MKHHELFNFAGKCLALDDHPDFRDEIREKLVAAEVNIDDLIWLCSNHLVLPVLYLKFRKYGLLDVFPDEYTDQLQEIYERNKDSNLKILEQMDEISALLGHEGIPHVYLKGAGNLLDRIYPDVGERMIGDIDFLVTENDFVKTTNLLTGKGYLPPLQIIGGDFLPPHHHFPRLTKEHEPATVEVHRMPVMAKYAKQFTSETIFAERQAIPGKLNVFVPSCRHRFIHNFIHSRLSNSGHRRWSLSLRDLYDGWLLSEKVNAAEIISAAEEKHKARVYYSLISRTFGLKDPEPFSDDVQVKRYMKTFNWWQEHPEGHIIYLRINAFIRLILVSYTGTIIKSVHSKSYRKFTWLRLKNPKWYKAHFLRLKHIFVN